jgi:hypothetical protein
MAFIHKHTKGEWKVTGDEDHFNIETDEKMICSSIITSEDVYEQEMANAKLISEAPNLLQFVEMFHDHLETHHNDSMLLVMIKETIKKAGVEFQKENE